MELNGFWWYVIILYPIQIRICYNRLIAKFFIDYSILANIKQVSTEV